MYIEKLKLKNYRNYNEIEISFDPKINIIYGNNAVGKTNLLESIFLCSTSKSHKNSNEKEIINFNESTAHIKLFFKKQKNEIIDIQLNKDSKKGIAVNGLKVDKLKDFLGLFTAIIFSPEDLNIIREGPQTRRKFLDIEICQIDKLYLNSLTNYNKVLNQKNSLLKDIKEAYGSNKNDLINLLDTYDEELIKYGLEVIKKRKKNIEELSTIIYSLYYNITNKKEEIFIKYENDIIENSNKELIDQQIKENYKNELLEQRENDIKNGFTSIGPHRDDISFIIDDIDLRKYGSQGQKKTAAICLKLAELILIKNKIEEAPVLLLDDVFSELDEQRQKLLIENINGIQTIITCTGMKRNIFALLKPNKVFQVENNKIIEKNL